MTNADKFHVFAIISFELMALNWDIPMFHNIAIGTSLGALFFLYVSMSGSLMGG